MPESGKVTEIVETILEKIGELLQPHLGTGMAGDAAQQISEQIKDRHKLMKEAMDGEQDQGYTLE